MDTPLNASASSAGAVFSSSTFEVPQFQREYSWSANNEVTEFWTDLSTNLNAEVYFLGLLILTKESERSHVVDGQQRLITLSLLATALYHEAKERDREALAEKISATFLKSINFETDEKEPRVTLSHGPDNETFQYIVNSGQAPSIMFGGDSVSAKIVESYSLLRKELRNDLKLDPFKRLGLWAEFIIQKLYFAVFLHPEPAAAYQVFEVINTRGKELTTADLLKNYILSQTNAASKDNTYERWQSMAGQFSKDGTNNFVQYIRHVVTAENGYVLPKDLYAFLAGRQRNQESAPHTTQQLMKMFEENLRLYLQMIDPSTAGSATEGMLSVFTALNSLGVITVRPMLLAIARTPNAEEGMRAVLRLVVHRIAVGSLGTGNVERRLGEAAQKIRKDGNWELGLAALRDLDTSREDFVSQLAKRSYNKATLAFLRRSIISQSMCPDKIGSLHFICPRQIDDWAGMDEDKRAFWCSTLGNTFLSELGRRVNDSADWEGFQNNMFPTAIGNEIVDWLEKHATWDVEAISNIGKGLAEKAANVWFD